MNKPRTIDQLIDRYHEPGNTSFRGTSEGLIALRTKREDEPWYYYTTDREGYYVLSGITTNYEEA